MQSRKVSTFLVFFLLLSFVFPCFVFGDASTTTEGTAYKSLDANTEMYAVTDSSRGNYVYYGMRNEQSNGVYYGRIARGGTTKTGQYGLINLDDLSDESIVSFYYGLDDNYSLEYWSYLYGKALDGNRALLVNLNYTQEGNDCPLITNGYYDSKLIETFKYLISWGFTPVIEAMVILSMSSNNCSHSSLPLGSVYSMTGCNGIPNSSVITKLSPKLVTPIPAISGYFAAISLITHMTFSKMAIASISCSL